MALNKVITEQRWQSGYAHNFIVQMKQEANLQLVPEDALEWFSKDHERVCFWMWCHCRLLAQQGNFVLGSPMMLNANKGESSNFYDQLRLDPHPRTAKARHQCVIDFIDQVNISIDAKLQLVKYFKEHAGKLFFAGKFSWMTREQDEMFQQYDWAYNYICNNKEHSLLNWFIPTPITNMDKRDAAIAAFDIWPVDSSIKELFIVRMRKAWSQKKHRASLEKKKKQSYNFTLTTKVKKMLDRMADRDGLSRNEVLEKLITEKYLEK
ncbi:TPA: hypothetical protein ACX3FG_002757 [Vibrio parahaemolyticus]